MVGTFKWKFQAERHSFRCCSLGSVLPNHTDKTRSCRLGVFGQIIVFTALLTTGLHPASARAGDPEGCLICHRYGGLARVDPDTDTVRLYAVDQDYYDHALGPHVRLKCSDCHNREEVAVVPHEPVTPVNCIRACHITTPEMR